MTADLPITQLLFLALLVVPSLVVLGGVVYISATVMPIIIKQAQQLIDNNTQLAKIAKQSADGIGGMNIELHRQTAAIEQQTLEIKTQGFESKSYQSLLVDGMHNHDARIEANTTSIAALRLTLEQFSQNFPRLVVEAIKDELQCNTLLSEFQALRSEVSRAVFQQQARSTGTMNKVILPPPLPDTPLPSKSDETT